MHHLYPRLEKELDFRLCLHFWDFAPGDSMANNIISAVQSSRRTILVLSPSYVTLEWCRMEYQMAQHEMLKLKHKIIPVVLEDVRGVKDMDKNLRCVCMCVVCAIMESVTYINCPGEEPVSSPPRLRFWKLLQMMMTKKKSEYMSSVGSSCSSCASDLPLTSMSKTCFDSITDSLSDISLVMSFSSDKQVAHKTE